MFLRAQPKEWLLLIGASLGATSRRLAFDIDNKRRSNSATAKRSLLERSSRPREAPASANINFR
jgi:hypothetical protein